jgi:hypothetical protein
MKVQIKLYDKKDFDYYNPRPYIKSLLKHLKTEDYNNVSYYFDESEHDYLFVWPADKQSSSNKRDRVIVENFAEVIKEKHMRKFISRFENYLDNKASDILEEIESLKKQIEKQENLLTLYIQGIQEKKNELNQLEGIVKQYAVQN